MSFGFPAYHKEIIDNKANYSIIELVEFLKKSKVFVKIRDEETVYFKTKINFSSYGENVEIRLCDNLISINSKCSFPFQFVDWGKNKKNVIELVNLFEKAI